MTDKSDRWIIKTLWIGPSLSAIERLALASFLNHGHQVELFAYDDIANIPEGVTVRDANEILSKDKIFKYKEKPSYAAFANWFRYEMLYREGGCWVDTDVVCLKPFDFDSDFFVGLEETDRVNNAVLGAEKGLEIFRFMAAQAENPNDILPYDKSKDKKRKFIRKYFQGNQKGNIKWGEVGPTGLTKAVNYFGLSEKALPTTAFYPIHCACWSNIFDETYPNVKDYFPDSYAIHLWNEMIKRKPGYSKDARFPDGSLIEFLKRQHSI